MIYFQQMLTAISLLQIPNGLPNLNEPEDAETSLNYLSLNIELSTKLISVTIPYLWEDYAKRAEEAKQEDLYHILGNFTNLLANITEIGANVAGADECTIDLKSTLTPISSTASSSQEDIFVNLQALANTEISKIDKQFKLLQAEYVASCGEPKINCDGTSNSIVAEVNRLIPAVNKITYDFLAEYVVLAYELIVDRQSVHAYIASYLDTRVQNITACIASKIEESALNPPNAAFHKSNEKESILDSYSDLVYVSENALTQSLDSLLSYQSYLVKQCTHDYITTLDNIGDAFSLANRTIHTLHNLAPGFNSTTTCALPSLDSVTDSSFLRALGEYLKVGFNRLSYIHSEGHRSLNVTLQEVSSIGLQVEGCSGSTTCDYLEEKIDRKMIEIPLTLRSLGNSTAVLLHQPVSSVRKSGYNIVKDFLEQAGAGIVGLKECIKSNLY